MESLTRRPHRRKHSASNGGVSSKNPYEDVVLSNWGSGNGKVFEARDYAEIFAGSSSIPVFDISSLDERVGSGEYRTSKVDYGDVFGGSRNHDVAVAYEELFNVSMKESNPCVLADKPLSFQDSGHRPSSLKGKRVSGGPFDPDKEQFKMSSSEIYQRNGNASHEKEEQAADETLLKSQVDSPKREVSRAWSFSPQVEAVSTKSRLNSDRPHGFNELNSSNVSESSEKFDEQTKATNSFDEISSPFLVEGFDENSPAGISAAALKKAVDEARERIKQAKMMMERRKKGNRDGSKRLTECSKSMSKVEDFKPVFTPSDNYIDLLINAEAGKASKNIEMEMSWEKIEEIEIEIETRPETTLFRESLVNEECSTSNLVPLDTVLASGFEGSENSNENSGLTKIAVDHLMKPEDVAMGKQAVGDVGLLHEQKETEKTVKEAGKAYTNNNNAYDYGNFIELVVSVRSFFQKDSQMEKDTVKEGNNLRISVEDEVIDDVRGTEQRKEKFCNFVENEMVQETETENGVHNLSDGNEKTTDRRVSELEMTLTESSNEQREVNLETRISDEESSIQGIEELVRDDEFMQSKVDCEKKAGGGDENEPESSSYDKNGVEELILEADTNDFSDVTNSSVVLDADQTSCIVDGPREDDDQINSFHVNGTDSEFHHRAKDYEEAVQSNTGSSTTVPEFNDIYSVFDKETEHEQLNSEADQIREDETLHRSTSDENYAENKAAGVVENDGNEEIEQDSEEAFKNTTVFRDAPCNSVAGVLDDPPFEVRTEESDLEDVRNSQERPSECCDSSLDTSGKEAPDGLSSFELKQGAASIKEELNSEPDAKRSNENERLVENTLVVENDKNSVGNSVDGEKDDQQQRIEAIRKGREREKDRIAVERAIREARERAKEKLERAAAEKQQAEKATTEAKLRAERAAVERVTAEARERALEKAKSLKITTATRPQPDKVAFSSRNDGLKHSFSSSDLEDTTYPESAQRHKARLERHQRVMERAAKALEEKNKRDLLVQKEQADRNRMAEYLDADIKRWSAGKEGNLRALLSTLHYILGSDSGWRLISLTEIITTADVKKAYRKATLCVHPDKLQQRGATTQDKYICEKVFDLLKAAWNKFNSEER